MISFFPFFSKFFFFINFFNTYKIFYFFFILLNLYVYSFYTINFNFFNFNFKFFNFNFNFSNSLLLNNINKYHPIVFYFSFQLLIIISLIFFNFNLNKKIIYYKEILLYKKLNFLYNIFFINVWSIFLGSWWAMQELSWGGWWNWDASETLGLLITFFILIIFHVKFNYLNILYLYLFMYTCIFFFF